MKLVLIMFMCSGVAGNCLPPHQMPDLYDNWYNCMNAGYQAALDKSIEIGKADVNQHEIFIRFACAEETII